MLVRVTKTVRDKGRLVAPDQVESLIKADTEGRKADWYCSPFFYGDDALAHTEKNNGSIAGYDREVWTDTLYWDLDSKESLELSLQAAESLLDYLFHLKDDFQKSVEVYFSGNKGLHVILRTLNKFTPHEVFNICSKIASEAGVSPAIFDTSVYNITRIFRIANTRHQVSSLYKVQIKLSELSSSDLDEKKIRELAKKPRYDVDEIAKPVEAEFLKERYKSKASSQVTNMKMFENGATTEEAANIVVPEGAKRCFYLIEKGHIPPGMSNSALLALAADCKMNRNMDRDQTAMILNLAMQRRQAIYPDADHKSEKQIDNEILKEVYSDKWRGGVPSCKKSEFLQQICGKGQGCCLVKPAPVLTTMGVDTLIENYKKYALEAPEVYPQFGIKWLDDKVRLRPRNFSIINGANGCVDADTEFLSPTGWKRIAEWSGEEVMQYDAKAGVSSFVKPEAYIKLPADELLEFKHPYGLDQVLSPEHRVLYYSSRGNLQVKTAGEIAEKINKNSNGFAGSLPTTFKVSTPGLDISESDLRLQVAVIADGYFASKTNWCVVRLKRERKKVRLEKLLKDSNIPYKKTECLGKTEVGYHRYNFYAPFRLKQFSEYFYQASQEQLEIIAEECLYWDGCESMGTFSTRDLVNAKFIQYAFSASGYRSSISTTVRESGIDYTVNRTKQTLVGLRSKNLKVNTIKTTDGYKYCFTVPTGFLVLRRNKNLFITGNSGKTSLATQLIDNLNRQKLYHIFFSADMADTSLLEKLGARYTQYDQFQIEEAFQKVTKPNANPTQKDQDIVVEVINKLKAALPYTIFDFKSTLMSDEIQATIQGVEQAQSIKITLAIIDYAGRVSSEHDNAYMNATQNALDANTIAKKCDCHIVYISQISREQGDHIKPLRTSRVSRDSGAWEENATIVLNIWRPLGFDPAIDRYIHLFIGKNRGPGVSDEHVMKFSGKEGSFRELTDEEYLDYRALCEEINGDEDKKISHKLHVPYREGFDPRTPDEVRSQNSSFDKSRFTKHNEEDDESDEQYERRTRGEGYNEKEVQASKNRRQFRRDA